MADGLFPMNSNWNYSYLIGMADICFLWRQVTIKRLMSEHESDWRRAIYTLGMFPGMRLRQTDICSDKNRLQRNKPRRSFHFSLPCTWHILIANAMFVPALNSIVLLHLFWCFSLLCDKASPCSYGLPETHYVDQAGLKLPVIPPLPPEGLRS